MTQKQKSIGIWEWRIGVASKDLLLIIIPKKKIYMLVPFFFLFLFSSTLEGATKKQNKKTISVYIFQSSVPRGFVVLMMMRMIRVNTILITQLTDLSKVGSQNLRKQTCREMTI